MDLLLRRADGSVCELLDETGSRVCYVGGEPLAAMQPGRYRVIVTLSPRLRRRLPLVLRVPQYGSVRVYDGCPPGLAGFVTAGLSAKGGVLRECRTALEDLTDFLDGYIEAGDQVWLMVNGEAT